MMIEKKIVKATLLTAMLVSMCGVLYIILAYSKYYFHSDCAGYLFLAKEQLAQKKMFPEGFHYTTDIFFLTPSVTMIPFLAVVKNELLAHELGVLLYLIILCALVFKLFWNEKKTAVIVVTLFLLPLSWVIIDMFFSQGAYLTECLFRILLLMAIRYLFTVEKTDSACKSSIACICFIAIGEMANYAVVRRIATDMLPALITFAVMIILREGISLKGILKQNKLLLYSISTIVIIVTSGIHYGLLCNRLEFDSLSLKIGLVDSSNFCKNILDYPALVLESLGWAPTGSLFSLSTIRACGILVYVVILQIFIPGFLLLKVHCISDKFVQFLVLYSNISNFTTFFVMVASGNMELRYYIPIYFNNLILCGLIGKWLLEDKYEVLRALPAVALLSLSVCIYGIYIYTVPDEWKHNNNLIDPKGNQEFYDFLLDNELTYGYATFWNAYPTTILSNEEIIIVAHDAGKPAIPYYFNGNSADNYEYYAISEDYYDTELHAGRCFVMIKEGETIPEQYYQLAEEMLAYEDFIILVYGKNIHKYPELVMAQ